MCVIGKPVSTTQIGDIAPRIIKMISGNSPVPVVSIAFTVVGYGIRNGQSSIVDDGMGIRPQGDFVVTLF